MLKWYFYKLFVICNSLVDLHQQQIWINICWTEVLSWDWFECEMLRRIDLSIVSERRPSRLHHLSSQTSQTNWINTFQTSLQWSRSKIMRFSIVISFALLLLGNFLIIIDHKKICHVSCSRPDSCWMEPETATDCSAASTSWISTKKRFEETCQATS